MLKLRSKMFDESSKSHTSPNIVAIILSFLAVFLVIYVAEAIVPAIVSAKPMNEALKEQGYLDSDKKLTFRISMDIAAKVAAKPSVMIPTLLSTGFGTLISIFYCRFFEMRHVRSMGARKQRFFRSYFTGMALGILMMTAIPLLTVIFGANSLKSASDVNYLLILAYLGGFLVQGMSEEFIFRGYLMTTIGGHHSPYIAIGISAVAFGLAHSANPGISVLAMFNLILFGVFAAVYMIYSGNIWGVCGIHSLWNFMQGNFYGISVSGNSQTESVLLTEAKSSSTVLTGGKFGIEGSIFTTLVLLTGTATVLTLQYRKEKAEAVDDSAIDKS